MFVLDPETSNIELRTSNSEAAAELRRSMFSARCSMFSPDNGQVQGVNRTGNRASFCVLARVQVAVPFMGRMSPVSERLGTLRFTHPGWIRLDPTKLEVSLCVGTPFARPVGIIEFDARHLALCAAFVKTPNPNAQTPKTKNQGNPKPQAPRRADVPVLVFGV